MLTQFAAFSPFLFPAQFADVTITASSLAKTFHGALPNKQFATSFSLADSHAFSVHSARLICFTKHCKLHIYSWKFEFGEGEFVNSWTNLCAGDWEFWF
jgi:hypothetical protein